MLRRARQSPDSRARGGEAVGGAGPTEHLWQVGSSAGARPAEGVPAAWRRVGSERPRRRGRRPVWPGGPRGTSGPGAPVEGAAPPPAPREEGLAPAGRPRAGQRSRSRSRCPAGGWECWGRSCGCPGRCLWCRCCRRPERCGSQRSSPPPPRPRPQNGSPADPAQPPHSCFSHMWNIYSRIQV